jgi:hypothetical protein
VSEVAELARRAERLNNLVEMVRSELAQLRTEIGRLQGQPPVTPLGTSPGPSCLAVALQHATDLGPEFNSEDPHALAGRGDDWF